MIFNNLIKIGNYYGFIKYGSVGENILNLLKVYICFVLKIGEVGVLYVYSCF